MKIKKIFAGIFVGFQILCFITTPQAYCGQDDKGNLVKTIKSTNSVNGYTFDAEVLGFDELMKEIDNAQIVYVGEVHNSAPDQKFFLKIIENLKNWHFLMEMDSIYQYILDKFNRGNTDSLVELSKQRWVGKNFLKRYKDICLTARQNHINIYAVNLGVFGEGASRREYDFVDIFDTPSHIKIVGIFDPKRDRYMAEKVIEMAKKNKKIIFYAGNVHLVNIPKIVSGNGDFKRVIIHQAALYLIDGHFYIDQLLDELLAKTGLDYLILRIDKNEYFVINNIPEDADRLTRKEFDRLVSGEIKETGNEVLFQIKADLDELLDQLEGGRYLPVRKILRLYSELSLQLNPDTKALLNK